MVERGWLVANADGDCYWRLGREGVPMTKTYYAKTPNGQEKEIKADSLLQALAMAKEYGRAIKQDVWLMELVAVLANNEKPLNVNETFSPVLDWLSGGAK